MLVIHVFTSPQSVMFLKGQTAFWRRKHIRLHVVCADGPELHRLARHEGFTYSIVPFRRSVHLLRDFRCLLTLIRLFWSLKPAVVHTNTPKASLTGLLAAWLTGIPTRVYEVHGFVFENRTGYVRLLHILMERLMGMLATHLLFVSQSLSEVAHRHRIGRKRPVCVPNHGSCNGIDARYRFNPDRFPQQDRAFRKEQTGLTSVVIGYAGRLTTEKGLQMLNVIWQHLRMNPDISLLIVGPTDSTVAADLSCIRQLAADPRVCVTGFVDDVAPYLSLMDVLISPTQREGFGNVLAEAAAMEVPVVASRVTGVINAVQDQQTGILIDATDSLSFCEAIARYLNNPLLRQQHGRAGRQRILRDFVPEDVWNAKYRFYAYPVTSSVLSS